MERQKKAGRNGTFRAEFLDLTFSVIMQNMLQLFREIHFSEVNEMSSNVFIFAGQNFRPEK